MERAELVIGNKNYSSWSLRAWLALKQLGVPFSEVRIPLDTHAWQREIGRHSPSRKVPVLKYFFAKESYAAITKAFDEAGVPRD